MKRDTLTFLLAVLKRKDLSAIAQRIILYEFVRQAWGKEPPSFGQIAHVLGLKQRVIERHYKHAKTILKLGTKLGRVKRHQVGPKNNPGASRSRETLTKSSQGRLYYYILSSISSKKKNERKGVVRAPNLVLVKNGKGIKRIDQTWIVMAELLIKMIQEVDGFRYGRHLMMWAEQFRLLHEEDGVSRERIWTVLRWYCQKRRKNPSGKLPQVYSGKMFRGTFGWILEKWQLAHPAADLPKDSKWFRIAERDLSCAELDWRIDASVLARLYARVDAWDKLVQARFDKEARAVANNGRDSRETLIRFTAEQFTAYCSLSFAEQVGQYLISLVRNWPKSWNGDLTEFEPGGKHFMAMIAARYREVAQAALPEWLLKILDAA